MEEKGPRPKKKRTPRVSEGVSEEIFSVSEEIVKKPPVALPKLGPNVKRLGIWGPQDAGKTAYLISLYLAARQDNAKWYLSLEDADTESLAFFNLEMEKMLQGHWPKATVLKKQIDFYNYVLYPSEGIKIKESGSDPLKGLRDFLFGDLETQEAEGSGLALAFADVAGERFLSEDSNSDLWNYISVCHGLVCILDPENITKNFATLFKLGQLLKTKVKKESPGDLLENQRYLPHYLSICFSKMDRTVNGVDWSEYLVTDDDPEKKKAMAEKVLQFLKTRMPFSIDRELGAYFSPERTTYHCISSVGIEAANSVKAKSTEKEKTNREFDPMKLRPVNVFDPLDEWIET